MKLPYCNSQLTKYIKITIKLGDKRTWKFHFRDLLDYCPIAAAI